MGREPRLESCVRRPVMLAGPEKKPESWGWLGGTMPVAETRGEASELGALSESEEGVGKGGGTRVDMPVGAADVR